MYLLALESSGVSGSAALLQDGTVLAERCLKPDQKTAAHLAPAIVSVLADAGRQPSDIDLVAVTRGPGSFTGLRVGVATAKTFAYAIGAEVLGVDTLEVLACQALGNHAPEHSPFNADGNAVGNADRAIEVCVAMDAQRRQLFTARFRGQRDVDSLYGFSLETVEPCSIADREPWLKQLPADALLTGPGFGKLQTELADRPDLQLRLTPATCWIPTARVVGELAFGHYEAGRRDDLWKLVPAYYRRSAAEEKRALEDSAEKS